MQLYRIIRCVTCIATEHSKASRIKCHRIYETHLKRHPLFVERRAVRYDHLEKIFRFRKLKSTRARVNAEK